MAERMGFEPMKELLLYTLSKRAPSTTRPPLPVIFISQYNNKKFLYETIILKPVFFLKIIYL